jgi:uncharacterized protein (DUF342 family)
METTVNYSLEDFIAKSEDLLEDVGDFDGLVDLAEGTDTAEKISDGSSSASIKALKESMDLQFDGYAEVWLAENEMSAVADFHPPTGAMNPIEPGQIAELLSAKGIRAGVDWDAIKEAVFRCNTERIRVSDVVVARGTRPIDEVPEHLLIEEQLKKKSSGPEANSARIDFKEVSPFVLVKEGQELAQYIPKRAGRMGITVLGKAVPYKTRQITMIVPGDHTRTQGKNIVADCDGTFEHNEHSFRVNEVLEIDNDVDYRTGHISFPGDVIIRGEVKDGFKVHSGGSVFCYKTLDASEVISKKDLIVQQGIIGRNKGIIKVGGVVKTKFIENCYLEAKGSVYVENGLMNSVIHTLKQVELGRKGVIIGGKIYAQDGVKAVQIGSAMGPRTEIYCGIDYSVQQKLEWIRDKNIELAVKLKQVEGKLKTTSAGSEKLLQLREKIKPAIHKLNEAANSMIFQLDKNEAAEVVVKGSIFPGAYIEICHLSYIVSRQMKRVRFKLDKEKGKIVAESLANDRRSRNVS